LIEVFNFLSGSGINIRRKAAMVVHQLLQVDNQKVTVLPQSHDGFLAGLNLYEQRLDKGYSLTDCISMVVMGELQIQEVLTHDHHFVQEGFQILFATKN
jgi:predicted nucleic acid-binding protein